jgi:hypothetical protein
MKNVVYLILALGLHLFAPLSSFGQDGNTHLLFKEGNKGVVIQSSIEHCAYPSETNTEFDYLMLNVKNTNKFAVELTFDKISYYNGACTNCDGYMHPDLKSRVVLNPGESLNPTCELNKNQNFKVLVRMSQHSKKNLTKFKIANVLVVDQTIKN